MDTQDIHSLFLYDKDSGLLTNRHKRNYRTVVGEEAGYIWVDKKRADHKYRVVKVYGKEYKVHRLIWMMVHGELPDGQIDHINGDTLDNRIDNLRVVNNMTNSKNRSIQSNNTSGYHGINQLPSGNWRVRISHNRKRVNIGTFNTFEEAKAAREEAEIKYNYHDNHGRR